MTNTVLRRRIAAPLVLCVAAMLVPAAVAAQTNSKRIEVVIYPILVEAPVFGASVDLPSLPGSPGGGSGGESGDQSGTTDVSLNTLYMLGLSVRAPRWFVESRGQWADLSASRPSPRISVDTRARFFTVRGGVTLIDGLSATVGVRRIWGELGATLTLPNLGDKVLSGTINKTLYDPLVGVNWRHRAGSVVFEGNFEGGGFGVGTDADVTSEFTLDWRFLSHMSLRLGYGFFYYKLTSDPITIGSFQRTLVSSQTLHGPILGIGIVF
jgi:hypothetical protein